VPVGWVSICSQRGVRGFITPCIRPSSASLCPEHRHGDETLVVGIELPGHLHLCLCRPRTLAVFIRSFHAGWSQGASLKVTGRANAQDRMTPTTSVCIAVLSRGMLLSFCCSPPCGRGLNGSSAPFPFLSLLAHLA